MSNDASTRRRWLPLALLFVIFVGPVLAAWLLWANADRWLADAPRANHGNLLDPARPLEGLDLRRVGAQGRLDVADLRGRWTLLLVASSSCDERCREQLYMMRQVRLALDKDMDRVRRALVLTDTGRLDALEGFLEKEHAGLIVTTGDDAALQRLGSQLPGAMPPRGRIYLVDPIGNLVMWYPPSADPEGMLKDLEHLLKVSSVG